MTSKEVTGAYHRKPMITYASDHNTAVIKQLSVMPISDFIYAGEIKPMNYSGFYCKYYLWFEEKGIGIFIGCYDPERYSVEELLTFLQIMESLFLMRIWRGWVLL